jgi:hypothetical protein
MGSSPGRGKRVLSIKSRPALGTTKPPIHSVPVAVYLKIKRKEREDDHSHPCSAAINNGGTTGIPQSVLQLATGWKTQGSEFESR